MFCSSFANYDIHVYMYTQNIASSLDLKYKIRFDNSTDQQNRCNHQLPR